MCRDAWPLAGRQPFKDWAHLAEDSRKRERGVGQRADRDRGPRNLLWRKIRPVVAEQVT